LNLSSDRILNGDDEAEIFVPYGRTVLGVYYFKHK
jgi:hypothetical protein